MSETIVALSEAPLAVQVGFFLVTCTLIHTVGWVIVRFFRAVRGDSAEDIAKAAADFIERTGLVPPSYEGRRR